ncbi:MAG TPA: AAA family ATPase, partial [Candidatus Nitrosotenuis sp.]|nr:AAA family ATPase [Candidatus Nitrosotenuis sp.]
GSGIFCDVAYLVHRLMSEVPIAYSCQGLMLTGLNPAADENCLANLYGSLTELNHWMAPDTTYRISLPPREVWESSRPPFEQVYLFPVVEPGDVPGTDAVFAQISAHLALHMAEQYSALEAEVARRHAAFAATDGRGNPVSYFSSGTAALSLPLAELAQAIAARLGSQVIGRWRNTLFRSDDASHPENEPQAHRFLLAQSLSPGSVKRALEESVLVAEGGRFDVRGRIARLRHELQQHPSYAAELGRRLMDCDRELTQAIGPEGGGLAAWLGRTSSELLRQRSQALLEEVSSFFAPGRETYLGFCVFLEQISDVISRHLNELYELLNQRESDDLRLLDEKKASLAEAAQYNPGPLSRLLRRQADGPVTRCLDLLEKYHENRVEIYLTRETLNLYLGLMDSLQRFSSGINELLEYLDGVGADLAEEERRAVERIFAVPGEVLLSRPEVERLLERRCGGAAVEQATEHLLAALGRELFSLPRTHPRPALVGEILSVLARQMVDMSGTDVFSAFIARYPGEAASDQLRLLFERARPAFLPSTAIPDYDPAAEPRAVYVALPGGSEPESVPKARLLEALDRLPSEAPLNVVPLLDREKVVFLRLAGGFPLGALDLEKAHRAYLQQLRFGPPRMHSRADVRWHALVRPSPRERQRVREILAVGLQLGLVLPGNEPGAPLVTPRWADPGTLFRCLELYPDMIEAFSVESHFLTALRRWQDEKVDEVGSEAYVRLLSEPRGELSLLGQSFEGDLARARAAFETQREERWPQWDRAIARALAQNPWLPANDLVSVPAGFRKWAMLRYIEAHPDEHLTYHAASARLELVSARELEIFRQQWRRVLEAGDENPEAWAEACRDLVRFLCHALGFTPGEALESGTFSGLRVTAHGMRVRLPSKIPFMVSRLGALTPDQAQVLRSLLESLGLDSRFALLLTPGRKEQAVQVLDQQLRAALRYDVIVLTPEDLRDILKVRDRSRALVAKILEQVDLTVVSPFVTEGPVPASMFFGREGEIKEILYRLDQASLALIGPRRIGKTSVLQRCLAALQSQNRPVLYIDCQAVYDYKGFLDLVAAEHLSGRSYGPWESPLGFRALLADLASLHAGGRLLFILDEVDLLLREDREGSEGLFRVFRSVSQGGLATFLFCGEKTLLARMK